MSTTAPTRLVVCVDGTWSTADGRDHDPKGNQTNMFRIASSVKQGLVEDHEGRPFIQKRKYFDGIGVGKKTIGRFNDGIHGTGCHEQIKAVYQYCCQQLSGRKENELWLYGFSRGAYVVRAVAGLIHYLRLLKFQNQCEFDDKYNRSVNKMLAHIQNNDKNHRGKMHLHFSDEVEGPIKLQFVGVFDTVKAFDDKNLFDISCADSSHHFRHAVSLNEDLPYLDAELVYPSGNPEVSSSRSMIQAWFVGAHIDLGGGAKDDGLSLYPLQWMLMESKRYGLVLEFVPVEGRDTVEDPLTVIFPKADQFGATTNSEDANHSWHFEYKGGIEVDMCDLRLTHHHPTSHKKRKRFNAPWSNDGDITSTASTYHSHINRTKTIFPSSPRKPFKDHRLIGYDDNMKYGTILHPSVYFLLDVYSQIYSSARISGFKEEIERFRIAAFPDSLIFPWVKGTYVLENENNVKTFRILVCGKAGAGKSTLINRVFGKSLTEVSAVKHGEHDIDVAFQSEFNPGLFIHDSRGFTTGSSGNVKTVENFLKKRSSAKTDVMQRIHAIWLCVKTDEERFIDDAGTELFKALNKYAIGVPIVVVGTMKDNILNRFRGEVEPMLDEEHYSDRETRKKEMEAIVQAKFVERQDTIAEVCRVIQQSRIVYTASNDADSINSLLQTTLECLHDEKLRAWVVGYQVCDIEYKIETAIEKSVRLCRHTIVATSVAPMGSIVVAPTMARLVCNVALRAFGFCKVSGKEFEEIMREVVWCNTDRFFYKTLGILAVELTALAFFGPYALPLVATTTLMAVPRTLRVVVACACDVILILEHAFSVNGQHVWPTEIRRSASEYKAKMGAVHGQVAQLIPTWGHRDNIYHKGMPQLRGGMDKIVQTHREGGKNKLPDASDDK